MASRGYDMTPTMYSPDGRIYQVEYAIETVKRGTLAIGLISSEGVIMAVEEKSRALQTTDKTQKIFQVDSHIGVAAAGYIPDARIMVDNARLFAQNNRLAYDEAASINATAKYLADQSHQFTQYSGVRPNGVSLIIAGVDQKEAVYVTDPSGTFVSYAAVAIGAGSDDVNLFLEKNYTFNVTLDAAIALTISAITEKRKGTDNVTNIKMAKITTKSKMFEKISDAELNSFVKNSGTGYGLGLEERWGHVVNILRDIIPVYDKVNTYISLGHDKEYRQNGIRGAVDNGNTILDAGSGYGNMSKTAMELYSDLSVVMYDPLLPMLRNTLQILEVVPDMANGIFEYLPFRDKTFDAVMCGYSLRDAINLRIAVGELHRVTKDGGRLIVVDLGKPDEPIIRAGVSFYLRAILPILALVAGGRLGLKFAALYDTYKKWPTNSSLKDILLEKYDSVRFQKGMMGGAIMVVAYISGGKI